jgi:hypothetical protein
MSASNIYFYINYVLKHPVAQQLLQTASAALRARASVCVASPLKHRGINYFLK